MRQGKFIYYCSSLRFHRRHYDPIQTRRQFYLLVSFDVGRVDADVSWRRRNDGVKLDDVIDEELHSMFEIFVTDAEAK